MKISIFKDKTYITGCDYSLDENCIKVCDIEFDENTQIISISNKFDVIISEKEIQQPIEPPDVKKSRITLALITSEDATKVDTEGVTGFDIDYMILKRFFGGDRGKEIGFTQRFAYLLALTDLTEDQQAEKTLIIEGYEAKEKYKEFIKSLNK